VPLLTQCSRGKRKGKKRKKKKEKTPRSIKRKKSHKLIIVEKVHYTHFTTDTHYFRKTLPAGGKSRRVKDNELPVIFTVL
jgi:hypothetical protein